MRQYWIVIAMLSACSKKHVGEVDPSSSSTWHDCAVVPAKRDTVTAGAGTLTYSVKCTAKEPQWIFRLETQLYNGDEPASGMPPTKLLDGERTDLAVGAEFVREGTFSVDKITAPWVVHAKIQFGYPGKGGNIVEESKQEDEERRKHPEKFALELSARFE